MTRSYIFWEDSELNTSVLDYINVPQGHYLRVMMQQDVGDDKSFLKPSFWVHDYIIMALFLPLASDISSFLEFHFFQGPMLFFWIRSLILLHVFSYNLLAKWNEILINLKLRVLVLFLNQFLTRDMYFFLVLKTRPSEFAWHFNSVLKFKTMHKNEMVYE